MTQYRQSLISKPRTSHTLLMCVEEAKVLLNGGTVWHVGGSYESAKKHYEELIRIIPQDIGLTYKYSSPINLHGHHKEILGPTVPILALEITKDQDIAG